MSDNQKSNTGSKILDAINANHSLAQGLIELGSSIQTKLLGTETPVSTGEKDTPEPNSFTGIAQGGLERIQARLLHLKDILKSIDGEF